MNKIKKFLTILVVIYALFFQNTVLAKTINFAVASDIHYKTSNDSNTIQEKALNGFIDRVNENNYDFVIFLGDNIDKSKQKELESFLNKIKLIKTPYYLVMGNKDVHKISGLDKKDYLAIVSKHNKYQKKATNNYAFKPTSDVTVIVLDSVSSGMPTNHGIFSKTTLSWLDETLEKNKRKKVLIFQHVPYLPPYEKEGHSILEKQEYKAILSKHKNILGVISGHYHKEGFAYDGSGVGHYCAPALSESPFYYVDAQVKYTKPLIFKGRNFKIDGTVKPAI